MKLNKRIDSLASPAGTGGLIVPLTPRPLFVLLALAEGSKDIRPSYGWPQDAVNALRSASPGGYAIADRTKGIPERTYCSAEPYTLGGPRRAYVHIHDDSISGRSLNIRDADHVAGMIEIACTVPVDPRHGMTGLHGLKESAVCDADALQASFMRLGLKPGGPLFVVAALLQIDGTRVSDVNELTGSWELVGTLLTPVVRMMPERIGRLEDLTGPRLTELYSGLWALVKGAVNR